MRRFKSSRKIFGSAMIIFLLFAGIILLCATLAIISWRKVERNTVYVPRFEKARFSQLREGATLDQVYSLVGPPLFIDVNPDRQGNGAYRQTRDNDVSLLHVRNLIADTNIEVYLVYSSMRKGSRGFYLYRLDVWNSKVFRRVQHDHID